MADLDLDSLLAPLQTDAPCGADLEYDPAFLALESAGAGKAEQQYGDTVIPAEAPDWPLIREQALALAQRSRDLRLAVWLLRSGARQHGFTAATQALQLLHGLLDRHWSSVHPQLDASDGDDPTMRLNALLPLVSDSAVLADLRAAALTAQRGGPRVRDVELALGGAEPLPDETVPSEAGLVAALAEAATRDPGLVERLSAAGAAARGIAAAVEQHLGPAQGPDFAPLLRLLASLGKLAARLGGADVASDDASADAPSAAAHRVNGGGNGNGNGGVIVGAGRTDIGSREDAIDQLKRVCDWIERHEPSNPAPLLIRRAQRLIGKDFLEIIRDLAPDGLQEIQRLAGPSESRVD